MEKNPEIAALLMTAVRQTCEVIFLTDAAGTIIYVNPAFEQLTGYSQKEAVGKNASLLKSGEQSPAFYKEMWATLKAGKEWSGRLVNRRKDGSSYVDAQRICPIRDHHGKVTHYLATRRDVTREMQLESQLGQSQKMESLGLLAGQISHDFNNLLTVIIGSMELIEEDLPGDAPSRKLAVEILRSSREAAALIKNLMLFARRSEGKPVPVSLNQPVEEMRPLLDGLLGKGVSVSFELASDLAVSRLETEQFKQAILNLAVNARDAMNGTGEIRIRTYNAGPDGLPPSLPQARYAAFEISDSGPGIPREVLPRIFEPFFTTKPKGKGTGLGLSTVYGAVTNSGGQIFAGNKSGGGAVFIAYFPVLG